MTRYETYTESTGDDDLDVEVALVDDLRMVDRGERTILANLFGANYRVETRGGGVPMMTFTTSVAGVVDFEHDISKFADVEVYLPHTIFDYGNYRQVVGVLGEVRLYPMGVDPMHTGDQDTQPGVCTECEPNHRFAAYLPPHRASDVVLRGNPVLVTITPRRKS